MRCLWPVLFLCLCPGSVTADSGKAGRAVFEGLPDASGQVLIGSDTVRASRFACRSCHRRDGRGGTEGDAPAIDWDTLTRPSETRPAYDATSFSRLLATGKTPSGRVLSRLMPRYAFEEPTVRSLIVHLSSLTEEQKSGVYPNRIVFGVPLTGHDPRSGERLVQALEAAFAAQMPSNGLYGRRIAIRALRGDAETILDQARTETIAVLSPPPSNGIDLSDFTSAGVPVLFPMEAVSENEDPSLVQSSYSSRERVVDLLLRKAIADGCGRIAVAAATPAEEADIQARISSPDMPDRASSEKPAECVLIAGGKAALDVLGPAKNLYITSNDFSDLQATLSRFHGTIIVGRHEAAALKLAASEKIGPLEAHATLIAATLHDALASVGRDITRASLISRITAVSKPDLGLAFSGSTPTGSDAVVFQVFDAGRKSPP